MNGVPADQPDRPILELRAITKRFPAGTNVFSRLFGGKIAALDDISFSVAPGETFGVLGEAGAGKTTLAQIVSGSSEPSSGQVVINGVEKDRKRGDDRRTAFRQVGAVCQRESVTLAIRDPDLPGPEALAAVGLNPAGDAPAPGIDSSQRQQIAAAIHRQATIVIADEPVTSRGSTGAPAISRLLPTLKKQHGWTLMVLSRELATVSQSDRLAVLLRGRLVELGPTNRVIGTPVHPYTQAFMEQGPHVPAESKQPPGCTYHPTCPFVMDVCKTQFPALEPKAAGHLAACHAVVPGPLGPSFRPEAGSARKLNRLRQREVMGTPE